MIRLKVVFDTNIYIAAALNPSGASDGWLRIAGREPRSFDLYSSEAILHETRTTLIDKFAITSADADDFIAGLREIITIVKPVKTPRVVERDEDDDMLFACALAAGAHLIISADRQVLKVKEYHGIGVAHPRYLRDIFTRDLDQAA